VLILRLFLILVTLLVVLSGGMYVFTRDRRYLKFAWQILRFAAVLLLLFAVLFVLERYVLTGWRVLL
jgi:threonine/homoserine/homoserine lactone efflux protein